MKLCGAILLLAAFFPQEAVAFSKLKAGLETVTTGYLIPVSRIVAGAALVLYATLSFFNQDEYQRKIGHIIFMAIIASAGLEVLDQLMKAFG